MLIHARIAIAVVILLALAASHWKAYHVGGANSRAELAEYVAKQQQELNEATGKVLMQERALQSAKQTREKQDAINKKTISDLSAGFTGIRLHDPFAASGCTSESATPSAANDSAGNTAEGSGVFSARASELLQRLTREADEINIAYIACRADGENIRR
jgi:hypothetical protein